MGPHVHLNRPIHTRLMNIKEAKHCIWLKESDLRVLRAWQWLYDNGVYLNVADAGYMDKLICDGHITIDK